MCNRFCQMSIDRSMSKLDIFYQIHGTWRYILTHIYTISNLLNELLNSFELVVWFEDFKKLLHPLNCFFLKMDTIQNKNFKTFLSTISHWLQFFCLRNPDGNSAFISWIFMRSINIKWTAIYNYTCLINRNGPLNFFFASHFHSTIFEVR